MRQPKQRQLAPLISLKKLSNRSQTIRSLIKQAETRTSFEEVLDDVLPPVFKGKFQILSTEGGTLTLSCPSASLMTKFRFSLNTILNDLNTRISPRRISNIRIKIRPSTLGQNQKKKPKTKKHTISKKNAQILKEEAEHTDDEKLKDVLLRLAEHSESTN